MKWGYKHNTVRFGSDAEAYVSRLFLMMKNPNGSRRPDLVSVNGRYTPKLSLEVKSGRAKKGVLVDYQLHYAVSTEEDYRELFGLDERAPQGILDGVDWATTLSQQKVAYYYDLIDRPDGNKSGDLEGKFSNVKIKWGDQFIVPHQYGFYAFAVSRHMRTGEPIQKIIDELWETIRQDVLMGSSHYESRKGHPQSWQDIHGRDALAIFLEDESLATKQGKRRIELIRNIYGELEKLKRVQIPGPNGTNIYVLTEPAHYRLFNEQVRGTVGERRVTIEKIARQRSEAVSLLDRVGVSDMQQLAIGNGQIDFGLKPLSGKERKRLELLAEWMGDFRADRGVVVDGVAPF